MVERKSRCSIIHLSTLIILVLTAGVLLGFNMRPKEIVCVDSWGSLNIMRRQDYGWPIWCLSVSEYLGLQATRDAEFKIIFPDVLPNPKRVAKTWDIGSVVIDALVSLVILVIVCLGVEYSVRKLE